MADHKSKRVDTRTVFDPQHRSTTLGIILGMSLVAFESLAVATVAPAFARSLGGMELYGWVFSSFLLTSLLGVALAGRHIDRHGLWPALAAGLGVFGTGLLVSGLAPSMSVLLGGRALQGLGGGALNTALYASINLAYPDTLRPRMMALLSTAWILPTLVGPALAGLIADTTTWRAIFLGIIPFLALLTYLIAPTFRTLRGTGHKLQGAPQPESQQEAEQKLRRKSQRELGSNPQETVGGNLRRAFQATLGAGLFLFGLSAATPVIVALSVVGALIGLPALRRLLPPGTFRARPGLGAVIASRGLFAAAFASVQVFLAVLVAGVQGYPAAVAGLVIASGSITWTLGAWVQERRDGQRRGAGRQQRVLIGTLILSVGIGTQLVGLAFGQVPLALTVVGWTLAGLGIGIAHATTSVLAFAHVPAQQAGRVSSALQFADQFAPALSTGVAGALFSVAARGSWGEAGGFGLAVTLGFVLALFSVLAAYRIEVSK